MFLGDGSANMFANATPKMVLPMSLQLGYGTPACKGFRAGNGLLIP
jgi:hypothetical protein